MSGREDFIIFHTRDGKTFAMKNLRFEIKDDMIHPKAEFAGDSGSSEAFLAELCEIVKTFFEEAFESYGQPLKK